MGKAADGYAGSDWRGREEHAPSIAFRNNLPAASADRSAKRLDITDEVIDFRARQRKVGHRPVRMGEKSAQLIRSLAAVGNRGEAGRALWYHAARIIVDYMAIGAPLPRELSSRATSAQAGCPLTAANTSNTDTVRKAK
jgi:hypothetical protein